jgi:tRNA(Ile)-lysidine synthase
MRQVHLTERVAAFIEGETLLEPGQSLIVGVSGGPDSLCLLDCLHTLGFRPVVAHFDHQLRPESGADGEFVRQAADTYGFPFELGRPPESGGELFSEEKARIHRYRFLANVAAQRGLERIAVGHTANDQAETVLMHLIRGAGSSGLRGMRPITDLGGRVEIPEARGILLIRPLLEVSRHDTEAYCTEQGLSVLTDPTNQDSRFFRNRLRNELIPELQTYNPRVQEVLLRTAKVMAAESEAIEQLVDERWSDWVTEAGEGVLAIQTGAIVHAPLALQRATIRRAILELVPELRDVGFETVERALNSIRTGKRLSLQGGLDLLVLNGKAYLRKENAVIPLAGLPQVKSKEAQVLKLPFQFALSAGWRLDGDEIERKGERPDSANEVWFDAGGMKDEISVRAPRPGDRMMPIGMSGSVKLSDLMMNRKVPRFARERWPVITCGAEIVWVPGLHRAVLAKVVSDTRRIIQMRVLSPEEVAR